MPRVSFSRVMVDVRENEKARNFLSLERPEGNFDLAA